MNYTFKKILLAFLLSGICQVSNARQAGDSFEWPGEHVMALSLTFDDARPSQVEHGSNLFDRFGVKATFYVIPDNVRLNPDGWKAVVLSGHEIGNHSLHHPCTGNFQWSREHALESYTIEKIRAELTETNRQIEELLGVIPESFAYPCGESFVGRGLETRSYVPLIAELFASGRGWLDETANDPAFVDPAQVRGLDMDGKDFSELLPLLESAKETGYWVVLAGHDIDETGSQTARLSMLEELIIYAQNPENRIWLAPVGEVVSYINEGR